MNFLGHLKVVNSHRFKVMKYCFKVGLYKQGLLHDLSKYSPTEFFVGVKYFQGTRSPNVMERIEKGYSSASLHHTGRNKHHFQYWIDFDENKCYYKGMPMPANYVVEMFMDRIAACETYQKENYTERSPLNYFLNQDLKPYVDKRALHLLEKLLYMLAEKGRDYTFKYIKYNLKREKRKNRTKKFNKIINKLFK